MWKAHVQRDAAGAIGVRYRRSDDKTFLNATVQQACRELRSDSPNTGLSLSTFEPFELKSANDHEIKSLLRHICIAAARSQAAVLY